jgi:hypothetical protein
MQVLSSKDLSKQQTAVEVPPAPEEHEEEEEEEEVPAPPALFCLFKMPLSPAARDRRFFILSPE